MPIRAKLVTLLFTSLFCSVQASADTYAIDEFEYNGVRLGMSLEDAHKAVAKHHSLSIEEIEIQTTSEDEPYPGLEHMKPLEWKLLYDTKDLWFKLSFEPSFDHKDDGYMILSRLINEPGATNKRRELQQLDYEIAIAKYGPPSYEYALPPSWEYGWCTKIDTSNSKRPKCDRNEPSLVISNGNTKLINPKVQKEWFSRAAEWPSLNQ